MEKVGIYIKFMRMEEAAHKCIQSVLDQDFKDFRLYIRVSPSTYRMVQEYADKDGRIDVLFSEIDGGVKNFNTDSVMIASRHDYVTIVDADDRVDRDYISSMYYYAIENKLDIVASGCYFINDKNEVLKVRQINKSVIMKKKELLDKIPEYYQFFRTLWGKLFSSRLWNGLVELPPSKEFGDYGGDTRNCFFLINRSTNVGVINIIPYYYSVAQNAESHNCKEGRLKSDGFLFDYVKDVLEENEALTEYNYLCLLYIYKHAIRDTLLLISKADLSEEQRIVAYKEILFCDRTKELLSKAEQNNGQGRLLANGFDARKIYAITVLNSMLRCNPEDRLVRGYYEIFVYLFPEYLGKINEEQFDIICKDVTMLRYCVEMKITELCTGLIGQMGSYSPENQKEIIKFIDKVARNKILSLALTNINLVQQNNDLIINILEKQYDGVLDKCEEMLNEKSEFYPEILSIYINTSALQEKAEQFINGKVLKFYYLQEMHDYRAAEEELNSLKDMGIELEFDEV